MRGVAVDGSNSESRHGNCDDSIAECFKPVCLFHSTGLIKRLSEISMRRRYF